MVESKTVEYTVMGSSHFNNSTLMYLQNCESSESVRFEVPKNLEVRPGDTISFKKRRLSLFIETYFYGENGDGGSCPAIRRLWL